MYKYFDFKFKLESGAPKTSVKLKRKHKAKLPAMRPSGRPYSGIQKEFYLHHIADKTLAIDLWTYRKKFASKDFLLKFMRDKEIISPKDWEACKIWLNKCSQKQDKHYRMAVSTDEYKESLKASFTEERIVKMKEAGRERWRKDYEKMYSSLHSDLAIKARVSSFEKYLEDPDNHAKYLRAMRDPVRTNKISNAAKRMWAEASDSKKRKMRPGWAKVECYRGIKMNKIEKIVAKILDSLNIRWEYEHIIKYSAGFIQPDFLLNDSIILECYGDFWHANPNIYDDNAILFAGRTAAEQRSRDKSRLEKVGSEYGPVIILWETEIKSDSILEIIKERVLWRL